MEPTPEQWEIFWGIGDVNRNGYIDESDLTIVYDAYGSSPGSSNWNPDADLDKDGKISIFDVDTVVINLGKNIWDYFGILPTHNIVFQRKAIQRIYEVANAKGLTRLIELLKLCFTWSYQ